MRRHRNGDMLERHRGVTDAHSMDPALIVIRGNSGSGKSTVAREVRRRYGRGCALVEQDYLRRILLRAHDGTPGTAAFIAGTVRSALRLGYHVVLEGILHTEHYAAELHRLVGEHEGPSAAYYLDVSWAETVRRHGSRPQAASFTPEQMREWYTERDLLGVPGEQIIPEDSTLDRTVEIILSGLASRPAAAPCPAQCPRCRR